ncbi:ankyrin repeat domain-containing protein [Xylophilus sp. GW821-FHT01B05]
MNALIACLPRRHLLVLALTAAGLSACATAGSYDDFFIALKRDDPNAIATLINRGFDPNAVNAQGDGGLIIALREPSPKALAILLQSRKTNVELRNRADESPLMIAVIKGDLDTAKALIARDADVNKPGWAPLHYAVSTRQPHQIELIKLLLDNYAFIDAQSPNGTTPLMMAAGYGGEDAAKLLLSEGADTTMRNQQGMTAADFARKAQRADLAAQIDAAARASKPSGSW